MGADAVVVTEQDTHDSRRLGRGYDGFEPAHVGAQRLGNGHRAVRVLVVFEHRDEGASHGQTRAVQRVDEVSTLRARGAKARLHTPGLLFEHISK